MQSKATTVAAYLASLPAERRTALEAVRKVIRAHIDADVEEVMQYGAIGYVIPHRVFPQGYHCDPRQPVPYVGLASQKQHMAVYLMCAYNSPEEAFIREAYAKAGRKLDLGKACLRFRRLEELDLEVLAAVLERVPGREYLRRYVATVGESAWKKSASGSGGVKKVAAKQVAAKKVAAKRVAAKKVATKRVAAKTAAAKRAGPGTRAPARKGRSA